jgi:hypothetical protein
LTLIFSDLNSAERQDQKIAAFGSSYRGTRIPVGAAAGCDLSSVQPKNCKINQLLAPLITTNNPQANTRVGSRFTNGPISF